MAHAGTMVGGSAQTKPSGSPWPAVALAIAVAVATIAGVWLASSASHVGGAAKPAADRSYDQIEAQRGAVVLSSNSTSAEYLDGILDRAHATPYVGPVVLSSHQLRGLNAYLNGILDRAHATPYAGDAPGLPFSATSGTFHPGKPAEPLSATSGTFHPGKPADQVMAPATRDRVGGP
jgi:hypothetical protein